MLDGLASVVIGLILVVRRRWLAYESKSLLVGEAADPQMVTAIREMALADEAVTGLGVVLTMHLGPEDVLLNIEVRFTPGLPAEEIHEAVHRIEERITARHPEVSRIFIEVEALRVLPPPVGGTLVDADRADDHQDGTTPGPTITRVTSDVTAGVREIRAVTVVGAERWTTVTGTVGV